jgi:two-component system phosphate regulon sensor histidine kinase PhoR
MTPSTTGATGSSSSRDLVRVATKNRQRIGYRRIVQLLVYLVILPTVMILGVAIVLMFLGEKYNLVFGILTVAFVSAVGTGVVLVLVFVRREANLSALQADFVSKVSHELRTPLTAIRLFAETIERASDEKTRHECVSRLITESERLGSRIERLLDWGRMEAGRKVYDLREEKVPPIIEETAEHFRGMAVGSDVVFEVACEPDVPPVLVDRHAIVDLLLNLLTNAQKYGGTPPRVKLRAFRSSSGQAVLEVSDNGGGIARGEHRRIFEKFYRIDDRLSRMREGSGLGLAIVKHIVRAHRARIEVDSAVGRGSKFRVLLPRWSSRAAGTTESGG